jgi:DNA-binding LacI/PurR family transcriptional regulator
LATIHDVARAAGVGVGTVSRVLNDSPLVSETTREKVQQVIDTMGYRPSSLARALSLGRSASLAVIVPHFTRPSMVERLRGLAEAINGSEFDLVLFDVETPDQRDQRFEMATRSDRAAGLVIFSLSAPDEVVDRLRAAEVPVVFVDRHVDGIPDVHIDDEAGGRLATEHLIGLGHRKIAFIGDDDPLGFGFTSSDDRQAGYRAALAEAGITVEERYVSAGTSSREAAHRLTDELLTLDEPPTAIFAVSDRQAFGVIEAAGAQGIDVPGDLSVMGFDDIDAAVYLGLTTVRQPLFQSGVLAAELVLGLLRGEEATQSGIEMPVELIVRKTTAPPR